ncbi:hypothetical protein SH661x_002095 [Planctomicrobium sp. SH661]|uniref:hypothetical protein n=1 Tax=Planctomicrobium sp. SH661 TaxID=3448124 RepID=UPI003F5C30FA
MKFSIRTYCSWLLVAAAACISSMSANTARADDEIDLPPHITYFSWYNPMGNYFVFYGYVADEIPYGCIVAFSGLLDNCYTSVDYDGFFYLVIELPDGTMGNVDAIAVDHIFQVSQPAGTWVFF